MALVLADRVQVTTSTTGTGTLTLGSAVTGFQDFTVIGDGNTTYYTITNGSAWEVGIGTYTASGTTLARTTTLSNSNGDTSPISLSGDSNVFVTYPAEKSLNTADISNKIQPAVSVSTTAPVSPTAGDLWWNSEAGSLLIYYTDANGSQWVDASSTGADGADGADATAFPAGTRMAFQQTSAPTGWTKDTNGAINDSVLRLVTGGVSSGGSTAFSTFNGQTSVGATTLSTAQMPSHNHTAGASVTVSGSTKGTNVRNTSSSGLATSATGGGGSHSHSLTTAIKYYDFIIATKD